MAASAGFRFRRVQVCSTVEQMAWAGDRSMTVRPALGRSLVPGESLGYDRWLKANTVKTRTHSLFRQGLMLYEHIPDWPGPNIGCVH